MNKPDFPHRLAGVKPNGRVWPADRPCPQLKALLDHLANPPLTPAEQACADAWLDACEQYEAREAERVNRVLAMGEQAKRLNKESEQD